jgi:AcrR family transcriptional regulator
VSRAATVATGRTRRRSRRAEEAILEASLALLGELGFSGLTMEGIAARAGVGKATIYRHWTSKAHVVVDAFRMFVPPVPVPAGDDFREELLTFSRYLVEGVTRSPLAGILPSLVEAAEHDPELERLFSEFGQERRAVLRGVFERAAARGELREGLDVELALELVVSPIFARRLVFRKPPTPAYVEQVVDELLPLFRPGLGVIPRSAAPAP